MKKPLLFLIVLFATMLQGAAQEVTNAFYLYRHDEPLRAFFFSGVDSICQSKTDIDSTLCEDYVVTEFWAADSVYRVPIAAIDSIAFTTPSTIERPGAIEISDKLMSYLIDCDSLTLRFSPSTPSSLLPSPGQKLYSFETGSTIEAGFLGQVRDIHTSSEAITVSCDSIGLKDVFKRLFFGSSISTASEIKPYDIPSLKGNIELPVIHDVFSNIELSRFGEVSYVANGFSFGIDTEIGVSFDSNIYGNYLIMMPEDELLPSYFLGLNADNKVSLSGSVGLTLKVNLMDVFNCDFIKIPIPYAPGLYVNIRPEIELSGTISSSLTIDLYTSLRAVCKWSSNRNLANEFSLKMTDASIDHKIDFMSTSITASGGVFLGFLFDLDKLGEMKVGAEFGRRYDLNVLFSKNLWDTSDENTKLYKTVRNNDPSTLTWYIQPLKVGLEALDHFNATSGYNIDFMPKDLYLLPGFSDIKYAKENGVSRIEMTLDDELLVPVQPGVKVVDEDGNVLYDEMSEMHRTFDNYKVTYPYLHRTFNKECTIQPYVKMFDRIINCEPTVPIKQIVMPETNTSTPKSRSATLHGSLRVDDELKGVVRNLDVKVGFVYCLRDVQITAGDIVETTLNDDLTFSVSFSGLQPETDYDYCAYLQLDGETYFGDIKSFKTLAEDDAIDLGLSVLWRKCNLGALTPQQPGDHYAWGETKAKNIFTWSTYFDNPYNETGEWQGCVNNTDISGNPMFDPATALGDGWRMPTFEETQELVNKCTWTWGKDGDINGYTVTGPNGNSIFIPANGLGESSNLQNETTYGAYWSSTPQTNVDGKATAGTLYFYSSALKSTQWANRYGGRGIRPVRNK